MLSLFYFLSGLIISLFLLLGVLCGLYGVIFFSKEIVKLINKIKKELRGEDDES